MGIMWQGTSNTFSVLLQIVDVVVWVLLGLSRTGRRAPSDRVACVAVAPSLPQTDWPFDQPSRAFPMVIFFPESRISGAGSPDVHGSSVSGSSFAATCLTLSSVSPRPSLSPDGQLVLYNELYCKAYRGNSTASHRDPLSKSSLRDVTLHGSRLKFNVVDTGGSSEVALKAKRG